MASILSRISGIFSDLRKQIPDRKFQTGLRRVVLRLMIWVGMVSLFLMIPEWLVPYFTNQAIIRSQINGFLQQSKLGASYDAVSVSFYSGITIHNLRISAEADFSSGRNLLHAESVSANGRWLPLAIEGRIHSVVIRNALLQAWTSPASDNPDLKATLRTWMKEAGISGIENVRLENSTGKWHIQTTSDTGVPEKFLFEADRLSASWKPRGNNIMVKWSGRNTGNGRISGTMDFCSQEPCSAAGASLELDVEDAPLRELAVFRPALGEEVFPDDLTPGSGRISLKGDLSRSGDTVRYNGSVLIQDLILLKKESNWYTNDSIHADVACDYSEKSGECALNGLWQDIPFAFRINRKGPVNPEVNLSLKMEPGRFHDEINLPGNLILHGLQRASLESRYSAIPEWSADIQIQDGSLNQAKEKIIDIENLQLSLQRNKLRLDSTLKTGESRIFTVLSGNARLIPVIVRLSDLPLVRGYHRGRDLTIAGLQSDLTLSVSSDSFHLSDVQPWLLRTESAFRDAILAGATQSIEASRLRDHFWFQRFVQNGQLQAEVNIARFRWNDAQVSPLSVSWKLDSFRTQILLDSPPVLKIDLTSDYPTNLPYTTIEAECDLIQVPPSLQPVFPEGLIESTGRMQGKFRVQAIGESPYEMMRYGYVNGEVKARDIRIGPVLTARGIRKDWPQGDLRWTWSDRILNLRPFVFSDSQYEVTVSGSRSSVDTAFRVQLRSLPETNK